jgi:hypothetical protein
MRTVTLAQLADAAGAPLALVERLVEVGQLRPLADDRFDPRSELIITSVNALLEAGMAEDDLAWVVREGRGGLDAIGPTFQPPAPRSPSTYRELQADLGAGGARLPAIYAAFGLVEPTADGHLRLANVEQHQALHVVDVVNSKPVELELDDFEKMPMKPLDQRNRL